jgi:hypothetical protein
MRLICKSAATEVNDLADAFRRALEECRIHSSMEVSLQESGQIQEMHPIVRDEVYRIGYESIRNACVHSQATQLRVELSYAQDLGVRIRDNGTGIDPDILHRGKRGHFGLASACSHKSGIELDPLNEGLYRGLMLCHQELGDHSDALHAYRRCRELLTRLLGVPPNAKTQALYHSVRERAACATVGSAL